MPLKYNANLTGGGEDHERVLVDRGAALGDRPVDRLRVQGFVQVLIEGAG